MIILESFWNRFGIVLGSFCDRFGIVLDRSGIVLGRVGGVLGGVYTRKTPDQPPLVASMLKFQLHIDLDLLMWNIT